MFMLPDRVQRTTSTRQTRKEVRNAKDKLDNEGVKIKSIQSVQKSTKPGQTTQQRIVQSHFQYDFTKQTKHVPSLARVVMRTADVMLTRKNSCSSGMSSWEKWTVVKPAFFMHHLKEQKGRRLLTSRMETGTATEVCPGPSTTEPTAEMKSWPGSAKAPSTWDRSLRAPLMTS